MNACVVKPEKEMGDTAATEAAATLQQILASSGALPLQLLPSTGDGQSQSTSSLPLMAMSPYQMMVLPQSLLSAHGVTASASGSDGQAVKQEKGAVSVVAGQSVADLLQKRDKDGTIGGEVLNQLVSAAVNQSERGNSAVKSAADHLKPPKKPLTPYMTFSKMVCSVILLWLLALEIQHKVSFILRPLKLHSNSPLHLTKVSFISITIALCFVMHMWDIYSSGEMQMMSPCVLNVPSNGPVCRDNEYDELFVWNLHPCTVICDVSDMAAC